LIFLDKKLIGLAQSKAKKYPAAQQKDPTTGLEKNA
jgi:hypothetical protein